MIAQLTRRRNRAESQVALSSVASALSFLSPININLWPLPCLASQHHHSRVRVPLRQKNKTKQNKNMTNSRNKNNTLEDIELPLRHFFSVASESDNQDDDSLLPVPAPSIRDQTIQINFETPLHRTITLSLSVDAGPGCGGIAWPAGEVSPLFLCDPDPLRSLTTVNPSLSRPYNVRRRF